MKTPDEIIEGLIFNPKIVREAIKDALDKASDSEIFDLLKKMECLKVVYSNIDGDAAIRANITWVDTPPYKKHFFKYRR